MTASRDPQRVQITRGGISATLDGPPTGAHAIAPTADEGFNTLAQPLQAVASWRMDSHRFAVGSSFVLPNSVDEFALLAQIRPPGPAGQPDDGPKLTVFGHADPTGTDVANKDLAGRRARSVYALLTRDLNAWDDLYANASHSDRWGPRVLRVALAALGFPSGAATNEWSDRAREAARNFQSQHGLPTTGDADAATRRQLFTAYMDLVCSSNDVPIVYAREAFLGEGSDAGGKADYQGCGEVNPLVLPPQKRLEVLQRKENAPLLDEAYRNNRRVVIYVFPTWLKGLREKWPCPRASEPGDGCRAMFWRDGDERRKPKDRAREHAMQDGTFACRFYDRFARFSPSERTRRVIPVYLLDGSKKRMAGTPFRATADAMSVSGTADSEGKALIEGAFVSRELGLEWGAGPDGRFRYKKMLKLDPEDEASDDETRGALRLHNLGYARGTFQANLLAFQIDHGLEPKPWPDTSTRDLLYSSHVGGTELDRDVVGDADANEAHDEPRGKELFR